MKKKIVGTGLFLLVVGVAALLCSLVIVPFATAEPIVLPQACYLITESFTLPLGYASHNETLSDGDKLHIDVGAPRGGNLDACIEFFLTPTKQGITSLAESSRAIRTGLGLVVSHGSFWTVGR